MPPPVKCGKRFSSPMNESGIANVASARYGPAKRVAISPNASPSAPATTPATRNRPEIAPAVVDDEDRRRVRADAHERAVAERDLAGEAGEDVQPEQRDQVDRDETELVRPVVRGQERRDDDRADERSEAEPWPSLLSVALLIRASRPARPSRPAGRTSRTTSSTASAIGSCRSGVTEPT